MNKKSMPLKEQHFKQIIEQNSERIQRICSYYAPTAEDRKDMYQEVLVNIWKSLDNFRGEAAISTWIYRIAVNTSISYAGKEVRRLSLNVDKDPAVLSSIIDYDADREISAAKVEELGNALNQLSVIDKLLISLSLEKLTAREIADIIGITEPNVRVKIHRIKENLRIQLNDNHEQQ
jgi:RNA polymerase sigma-70 factor (ECF subfamily)